MTCKHSLIQIKIVYFMDNAKFFPLSLEASEMAVIMAHENVFSTSASRADLAGCKVLLEDKITTIVIIFLNSLETSGFLGRAKNGQKFKFIVPKSDTLLGICIELLELQT